MADGVSVNSKAPAIAVKDAAAHAGNNSSYYMTDPHSLELSLYQSQETSGMGNRKPSRLVEISR